MGCVISRFDASALRREEASLDDLPRVAVANAVAVDERVDEKLTFR
jgi:hypothetical protein